MHRRHKEKIPGMVSLPLTCKISLSPWPSFTAARKRQTPHPPPPLLMDQTEGPDLNIHTNRQLIKVRASLGLIPCRAVETEAAVVF